MNFIKRIFKQRKHKKELEKKYNDAWFNLEAQSGIIHTGTTSDGYDPDGNFYDSAYTKQIANE